ncbi:MAG TPA: hypothetical protein VK119_07380 [Bacillota bacterium]|nr:hypothetical protein [Bacillota bacterium]
MKRLKTVKGKVILAAVAAIFLFGGGLVFANTDAGDALRDWYERVFDETVDSAKDGAEAYVDEQLPELQAEYEDRKNTSASQMDRTRDYETGQAIDEIDAAKDHYIEDIEGAQNEIMADMEQEFYNVYVEGWKEIQRLSEQAGAYVNDDLPAFAEAEGEAAREQMTEDLTVVKEEAVSDLEEAIEAAKGEISEELDVQGENLENNLKTQIDHEIENVRRVVKGLLADLTAEQQKIIEEHAQDLEDEAKNALDEVVAGINE